jgi:hypothetical protein
MINERTQPYGGVYAEASASAMVEAGASTYINEKNYSQAFVKFFVDDRFNWGMESSRWPEMHP